MKTYQHTQSGKKIVIFLLVFAVVMSFLAWRFQPVLFVAAGLLLLSAWLFNSLTIVIDKGELRWKFGSGMFRKNVALSEIESVKVVRTLFVEGWGIHLSRFGWLYNISGYGAVAVTLKNGKRFALGSDEPERLAERILAALKA